MESPVKKGKSNLLTQADSYRLYRWIDEHRPDAARLTAEQLAEMATRDIGIKITPYNAQSARLALGIRVSEIRQATTGGEDLKALAGEVCDLALHLGRPLPAAIARIAGRLV